MGSKLLKNMLKFNVYLLMSQPHIGSQNNNNSVKLSVYKHKMLMGMEEMLFSLDNY